MAHATRRRRSCRFATWCARFGAVQALRGVDLDVRAGEVVGLLGPNGAGKTTLVHVIATLLDADDGHVAVCGADVARQPARARRHLGLAGQYASVDELLTGRENLELIGRLYGLGDDDCRARSAALIDSLGLAARRRAPGGHLLGWDAAPARPRRHLDRRTGAPAPRRAHHRPRPTQPPGAVGPHRRDRQRRDRRARHQPEPRRDRAARRPSVVLDGGAVIADDTVDAIRRQIGGQILDVAVDTEHLDAATTRPASRRLRHPARPRTGDGSWPPPPAGSRPRSTPPTRWSAPASSRASSRSAHPASKKPSSPSPTRPPTPPTPTSPPRPVCDRCPSGHGQPSPDRPDATSPRSSDAI